MSPPSVNNDVPTPETSSYGYVEAATTYPTFAPRDNQDPAKDDEHQPLLGQSVRVKYRSISRAKALVIIACIACTTGTGSLLNGHVIVALPMMAHDLGLSVDLMFMAVAAFSLASGCTLLLSGAVADATSSILMFLLGCFLQCLFTSACGFAQTGMQLVAFRALSGVAASFCLPAAVSIIYDTFPAGPWRNAAFASMGGSQPIGFSVGLVGGGFLAKDAGWPWGFHVVALTNTCVVTTADTSNIRTPTNIFLLGLSLALMPAFVAWVSRQEHNNRPALIPNSLWRNKISTSICINIFLMWGAYNAFEQVINLFFQEVQGLDALETALHFLPQPLSGLLANLAVGLVVHRIRGDWIILATTIISCISPLLMALIDPSWSYWVAAFPAVFLNTVGADIIYTISNLLIMFVFPGSKQGLAGGVLNTVAQIGNSLGLAVVALLAESITMHSSIEDKKSPEALMEGYRAAFWFMFALSAASFLVSCWGLHGIGRVGREVVA
ncbi:MAG: hypothetical protein Q9178_005997 [Gyalolechia marmorata]